MDNDCIALGDDFEIISAGNTTIIHCQLSIIHSCVSTINGNLSIGQFSQNAVSENFRDADGADLVVQIFALDIDFDIVGGMTGEAA